MATPTTPNAPTDDVIRRGIPRELPCKLDDTELLRIAKTRVTKEAELAQLQADLKVEVDKRKAQIEELADEIALMGRELRTEEQQRTIKCNEVFRKHDDGSGWGYVMRQDTFTEVERRPATAHETQRYFPSMDAAGGKGGLLAQAEAAKNRSAQPEGPKPPESNGEDVPKGDDDDKDEKKSDASKKKGK